MTWWLVLIIGYLCFLVGLFLGGLLRAAKAETCPRCGAELPWHTLDCLIEQERRAGI